ncbi:hypothetical protein BT69DRAFT_1278299, partial [Atractiella rhizophila]
MTILFLNNIYSVVAVHGESSIMSVLFCWYIANTMISTFNYLLGVSGYESKHEISSLCL